MTTTELPPVPWPFIAQPELYHMAVRLYLDTVVERASEKDPSMPPSMRDVVDVIRQDARALKTAKEQGEPV